MGKYASLLGADNRCHSRKGMALEQRHRLHIELELSVSLNSAPIEPVQPCYAHFHTLNFLSFEW